MKTYIDMTNDGYIGNRDEILSFWTKRGAEKALKRMEYQLQYLAINYCFSNWYGGGHWATGEDLHIHYELTVAKLPKMAPHRLGRSYYIAVSTITPKKDSQKATKLLIAK